VTERSGAWRLHGLQTSSNGRADGRRRAGAGCPQRGNRIASPQSS
jgi:hypothetical protein